MKRPTSKTTNLIQLQSLSFFEILQKFGLGNGRILLFLGLVITGNPYLSEAQQLKPLTYNPTLSEVEPTFSRMKKGESDTLSLPFIDDFSYEGPYPDDSLWRDKKVYINRQLAIDPPTYGVATFEGLNANGRPYNPERDNRNQSLPTDTLTSTWLDLSNFQKNQDSVYLCFWYQEKGLGDAPAPVDSFSVQVKTKADTPQWKSIWSKQGKGELPTGKRSEGVVVLNLANADSNQRNFFFEGFQFRFLAYGNVSGNLDHWHLDYVTLTEDRVARNLNGNLTLFNQDVAMVEPPASLLKQHRAMPWRQVEQEQVRDSFNFRASNVDRDLVPVEAGYRLEENYSGYSVNNFDLQVTANVDPLLGKTEYSQRNQFEFLRFVGEDSLRVTLKPAVFLFGDDLPRNDTLATTHYFNHYIAYDDGSPEAGFGIEDFFQSAKVAQSYALNKPDTLQAVGIRFNQSLSNVEDRFFDIVIWSDLGPLDTKPANASVKRRITALNPKYDGRGRHDYGIYELEEPLPVRGRFYIGWQQSESYFLNVGVDKNYKELFRGSDFKSRVFYNASGSWVKAEPSLLDSGILTIRPYLGGDEVRFLNRSKTTKNSELLEFKAYPNPATNQITLSVDGQFLKGGPVEGKMINQKGQVRKSFSMAIGEREINVQGLTAGIYFIALQRRNLEKHRAIQKVIIR